MDTPSTDNFDTIIKEFDNALARMGPSIGSPVTRAERALLKTFYLFLTETKSYTSRSIELGEKDVKVDSC